MKNYYYILGLLSNASIEDIKLAHRKLALKFHPDKNAGDKFFEERFKEIQEAYECLSNESSRRWYDYEYSNWVRQSDPLWRSNSDTNNSRNDNDGQKTNNEPFSPKIKNEAILNAKKKKTNRPLTVILFGVFIIIIAVFIFIMVNKNSQQNDSRDLNSNTNNKSKSNQFEIGQLYRGGVIAYLLKPDDPGYNVSVPHGLIAAPYDQCGNAEWGCYWKSIDAYGITGKANTKSIAKACGKRTAAYVCYTLRLGGYKDWYLPSKDELHKLYLNKEAIGGFQNVDYWSSNEDSGVGAWFENFFNGKQDKDYKFDRKYVRAVRMF